MLLEASKRTVPEMSLVLPANGRIETVSGEATGRGKPLAEIVVTPAGENTYGVPETGLMVMPRKSAGRPLRVPLWPSPVNQKSVPVLDTAKTRSLRTSTAR